MPKEIIVSRHAVYQPHAFTATSKAHQEPDRVLGGPQIVALAASIWIMPYPRNGFRRRNVDPPYRTDKSMNYRFTAAWLLSIAPAIAFASDTSSERVASSLTPYLDENTLAVAAVKLNGRWMTEVGKLVHDLNGGADYSIEGHPPAALIRDATESLHQAGGRELALVVGMYDLSPATLPMFVVTTDQAEQVPTVAAYAGDVIKKLPGVLSDMDVVPHEGSVLIGSRSTLDRYQQLRATPRRDLLQPLEDLLNAELQTDRARMGLIVSPGVEARRVLRALWPELPKPFAKLDGDLVSEKLQHIALEITSPPQWHASLTVATREEHAAATVKQLINDAWQQAILAASQEKSDSQAAAILRRTSKVLAADQEASNVLLRATHDDSATRELLSHIILPMIGDTRADALRRERMNQFKHLALALLNFEASMNMLPASAAIVSEEGKPLLSWRVAVLPYLEQSELFKQFRTDEPWDSPHNLKLVARMPEIYADPRYRALADEGKTTYLVPVHAESVFPPLGESPVVEKRTFLGKTLYFAKGTTYREIVDGTSNTILAVEVPPEQAVIWTQPADWEVDLQKAWQQLRGGSDAGATVTAFCDGHAKAWDHERDKIDDLVPMVITHDGREVIDWNQW